MYRVKHLRTALCIGILISTLGWSACCRPVPVDETPAPALHYGTVSVDGVIKFEDVESLGPVMTQGLIQLRAGKFQAAQTTFRAIEQAKPTEALAYRGEVEAARGRDTLDTCINEYRLKLAYAERHSVGNPLLAVLNYALGTALMSRQYVGSHIDSDPLNLGSESKQCLIRAIHLSPSLLVAHLALAAYYEHPSQSRGSLARQQYEEALRLRPDLYKIRFLHALTWNRPGLVLNSVALSKSHIVLDEDHQKMTQNTISECLTLIRDHPEYAQPYFELGNDYLWPTGDKQAARKYLTHFVKIAAPGSEEWASANQILQHI